MLWRLARDSRIAFSASLSPVSFSSAAASAARETRTRSFPIHSNCDNFGHLRKRKGKPSCNLLQQFIKSEVHCLSITYRLAEYLSFDCVLMRNLHVHIYAVSRYFLSHYLSFYLPVLSALSFHTLSGVERRPRLVPRPLAHCQLHVQCIR